MVLMSYAGIQESYNFIIVQACGLKAIPERITVRTCSEAPKSLQTSRCQVEHVKTVCSPILASVVAANALLLADLMRVSLLNCSA